jgi:putative effector of murein hydrolase LrgA (UPF0299 family)
MAASGASVQSFIVLEWRDPKQNLIPPPEGKMIAAFAGIFGCQLLGEFIVRAFAMPLPGPVLGMFLLFVALVLRGGDGGQGGRGGGDSAGVPKQLGAAADGLLGHLSLLFVPASVGLMRYFDLLSANALTLVLALSISTALAMAATALTFRLLAGSKS